MPKTNIKDAIVSKVGVKKIYCGCKNKFGLNLEGVCGVKGRHLDATIGHLGSTSDCLAFVTSKLHAKLENPGFIAPGLVLHGGHSCV